MPIAEISSKVFRLFMMTINNDNERNDLDQPVCFLLM